MAERELSKEQVGVLSEYADLLLNNYIPKVECFNKSFWYIRLHHLTNGRILTLKWSAGQAVLMEGKKVLKDII